MEYHFEKVLASLVALRTAAIAYDDLLNNVPPPSVPLRDLISRSDVFLDCVNESIVLMLTPEPVSQDGDS